MKNLNIRKDLLAGLIVFLIALPLCLGIAQASNAPLFSGIIAGVVGGIVIGALSKSTFSVSGPAAGLVAIVISALTDLGAFELFLCAVVLSGLFQLILGVVKAGTFASFFPSSVIEGMLAGIGLTIIYKQLRDAVGFDDGKVGMYDGERGMDFSLLKGLLENIHWGAVVITLISLAILILWNSKSFKKIQIVPAGLVAVIVGTLLNYIFQHTSGTLHLEERYLVQLEVPNSIEAFLGQFSFPDFNGFLNPKVWQHAAIIAIVASIETLLCIEATDKLDPLKRNTPGNSELKAQGIGNMISGFIGGLPITSVIVRSSANINAGAQSKFSAIFHGILLLVCVSTIPFILNTIPKSTLAAILIYTGYKLAMPSKFKHMYRVGRTEFIPFVVTSIAVALPFLGLLKGVALGMVISVFYLLRSNMKLPFFYTRISSEDEEVTTIKLAQEVSFLNKAVIKKTLNSFPEGSNIVLDASNTEYIDYDILEIIREFYDFRAPEKNIKVTMKGFRNIYKIPEGDSVVFKIMDDIENGDEVRRTGGKYTKLITELNKSE